MKGWPSEGYCKHEAQDVKKCLPSRSPFRVHIQLTHLSWPVLTIHSVAKLKIIADTRFWCAVETERESLWPSGRNVTFRIRSRGVRTEAVSKPEWPGDTRSAQPYHENACLCEQFQIISPTPARKQDFALRKPFTTNDFHIGSGSLFLKQQIFLLSITLVFWPFRKYWHCKQEQLQFSELKQSVSILFPE